MAANAADSISDAPASWRTLAAALGRQNDVMLALLLVVIVALFVLPLPTPLIDFLITTNLMLSLVLLIIAMYVPSALSLSTFPSLLLFTTLFRLALNIASTKLILLHADAGDIIDTFGKLIVGNNIVVGGVVFLVIAIVQFIVIAKGSERVAEVAARFALDAMPGKQMSIDADVRAGVMSSDEAQRRRRQLSEECQLHGAMDGAMKFVKGDAIAGIVIALINILAGIAIGSLMHGMPVGDALQRYAVLTVGDGMVSQIPSLLVSIAAGVVITRVTSIEPGKSSHLASHIGRQVMAHPRALLVAGLALSGFLLVPGFPKWTFGLWALVLGVAGLSLLRSGGRHRSPAWVSHAERESEDLEVLSDGSVASALALHLSPSLRGHLDREAVDAALTEAKEAIERDLGPIFPSLRIRYDARIPDDHYAIFVQDVEVARAAVNSQGGSGFGNENALAAHVQEVVRSQASRLIGIQDVQCLIHRVQRDAPDLAAEISRVVPLPRITEVLQRLLQEGIPIRNLRFIFESLVAWAPNESDTVALTELVRVDMGRYITSLYVGPDRRLQALLFDTALLDRLQTAVERSARGSVLALSPAVTKDIRSQVTRALAAIAAGTRAVVVVPMDIRRYVKKMLIEPVARNTPVLSYQELEEDVALQPLGWVTNPQTA